MTRKPMYIVQIILVSLLLISCTIAAAAAANNLTITKSVSPSAVYTDDAVTWKICLKNNASQAVDVTVQDELYTESGDPVALASVYVSNETDSGEFNSTTGVWTIKGLAAGETTTLTLETKFSDAGNFTNWANITESCIEDAEEADNQDSADVVVKAAVDLTGRIIIKPETLNLKSKGAFHVFVNITGEYDPSEIDLENSNITCNGATADDLKIAGAGDAESAFAKIIAKFDRQELVDTSAGDNVMINCSGYIVVGDETIKVEGSDEIRVNHEQNRESFLDKILKFFGFKKGDAAPEEGTLSIPSLPEDIKNLGQGKKFLKTAVTTTDSTVEETSTETDAPPAEKPDNGKAKGQIKRYQEQCQGDTCEGAAPEATPTPRGKGNGKKTAEEE